MGKVPITLNPTSPTTRSFSVTALVCQVTGGPEEYHGRNMKEAHKHLNITEEEWEVMVAEFQKTLDKFNVPKKEQKELFDIVGSTKADIVVSSASESE